MIRYVTYTFVRLLQYDPIDVKTITKASQNMYMNWTPPHESAD